MPAKTETFRWKIWFQFSHPELSIYIICIFNNILSAHGYCIYNVYLSWYDVHVFLSPIMMSLTEGCCYLTRKWLTKGLVVVEVIVSNVLTRLKVAKYLSSHPLFSGIHVAQSSVLCIQCRYLSNIERPVLFDLRPLITPLILCSL